MKKCNVIDLIAIILLLVGGINWGLVGFIDYDLIGALFGEVVSRIIFALVGIAAIYRIVCWVRCKNCK